MCHRELDTKGAAGLVIHRDRKREGRRRRNRRNTVEEKGFLIGFTKNAELNENFQLSIGGMCDEMMSSGWVWKECRGNTKRAVFAFEAGRVS